MASRLTKILQNLPKTQNDASLAPPPKQPTIVIPKPLLGPELLSPSQLSGPHSPTRPSPFLRRQSLRAKAPEPIGSSRSLEDKENQLIRNISQLQAQEESSVTELEKSSGPLKTGDKFSSAGFSLRPEGLQNQAQSETLPFPMVTKIETLEHLNHPPTLSQGPRPVATAIFQQDESPTAQLRRRHTNLYIMKDSRELMEHSALLPETSGIDGRKTGPVLIPPRRGSKLAIPLPGSKRNSINLGRTPPGARRRGFMEGSLNSLSFRQQRNKDSFSM